MAWHNAMAQGTSISFGRIAIAAATIGGLLLILTAMAHGDDGRPPYPVRSGPGTPLPIDDDCQSFTDLPATPGPSQTRAPHLSSYRDPAARAVPAVWTEYRGPPQPLRGAGNDWIFIPFDGCTGSDTGDFDLRNPSGSEAVFGARSIAIGFQTADPGCAPVAAAIAARPCRARPGWRPPFSMP
jgi:hypothetical protein